jgi:malonyl-CoA decarboxylase
MNTSEWISRSVSKLLPVSSSGRKRSHDLAESALPQNKADSVAGAVNGTPTRTTRERLAGSLRRKGEALSPRELRRILTELQAVVDNQISEVEGGRRAREVSLWYGKATPAERQDCWLLMSEQFAPDPQKVRAARGQYEMAYNTPDEGPAEIRLRRALVSPRTRLLQRFSVVPEGIRFLVGLRSELLNNLKSEKRLLALDAELENLFSTWFDIAFLELRRISWDSPASLIEKLIKYEAVHDIRGWNDVRNRLDSDRRCYGFFHPKLPNEPLIFVEVALLDELPQAIAPLLDESAAAEDLTKANTAIFYSISNTQAGLRGVSFGDSLIKRVVETLKNEFPRLKTFATLSPIPGFAVWMGKNASAMIERLAEKEAAALAHSLGQELLTAGHLLDAAQNALALEVKSPIRRMLMQCAAYYLRQAQVDGKPVDPVTRFHLGNGARIERINWAGDPSVKGFKQSYGMMVNYLYDLKQLDKYRARFAKGEIVVSAAIQDLAF